MGKLCRYATRYKIIILTGLLSLCIAFLSSCLASHEQAAPVPEAPFWWANPHGDDVEFMYEKASAEGLASEHAAREKVYENALSLLSKRIYAGVSSDMNSIKLNSRHAFSEISLSV